MTVTVASFRSNLPEFADATVYTDASIQRFITLAANFINPNQWGTIADYGTELWVAHNIAIAADKIKTGDVISLGAPTVEKHVGEVGYSQNPGLLIQGQEDIGLYAKTTYGIQFWQLMKLVGTGGIQL